MHIVFCLLSTLVVLSTEIHPAESFIDEAKIVAKALELATPFTETSLSRLHTKIFGRGRAARSSDIVIFNKTDREFKLRETSCHWGGWSKDMLPEPKIPAHMSVAYGAESQGFMTGYSDCVVKYRSKNSKGSSVSFELSSSNPYWSPNKASGIGNGVNVITTLGKGMNNGIQFIIDELDAK